MLLFRQNFDLEVHVGIFYYISTVNILSYSLNVERNQSKCRYDASRVPVIFGSRGDLNSGMLRGFGRQIV